MADIHRESEHLRQRGTPEDAVVARLEERLQDLTDRLDAEVAEKLSGFPVTQASATRLLVSRRYRLLATVAILGVVGGSLLEMTIGDRFVFSASDTYRAGAPWLLAAIAPLSAWLLLRAERVTHGMASRYPTWWVRWLFVFPLTVLITTAMVAIAPLGWFALYGRLSGTPTSGIEARMLSVAPPRTRSRDCDQVAEIRIDGSSAKICLSKVLHGRIPAVGESVVVIGRKSLAGVFIDKVSAK